LGEQAGAAGKTNTALRPGVRKKKRKTEVLRALGDWADGGKKSAGRKSTVAEGGEATLHLLRKKERGQVSLNRSISKKKQKTTTTGVEVEERDQ